MCDFVCFQTEEDKRDVERSGGRGDVYKREGWEDWGGSLT